MKKLKKSKPLLFTPLLYTPFCSARLNQNPLIFWVTAHVTGLLTKESTQVTTFVLTNHMIK